MAGGPTGKAFIYDASTGAELAAFQLTPTGQPTFINDVVLTGGMVVARRHGLAPVPGLGVDLATSWREAAHPSPV